MKKPFTEEQIIGFLREADAGLPVKELCRKHGFSEPSYYAWKAKFGGVKATVQGNDMYPERISALYGLGKGCNFFAFTGTTFVPNARAGCTNYAVGSGVINAAASGLSAADPRGIPVQFAAATAAGNYASGDLLRVDGGGNDAAALVGAYLAIPRDGGASYTALLGTLLTPQQVQAAAGATCMTALAASFHTLIKRQALDKGAQRIALLNMPGITKTPRFQPVVDGIAAASGPNGASARAERGPVQELDRGLQRRAGDGGVATVDFYKAFNDQVATLARYGLTNVKDTACPATGVGSDGLPTYSFPSCTDAALGADPRAAGNANWYKSWAFSDGFHPTPYGHQLLAQLIAKSRRGQDRRGASAAHHAARTVPAARRRRAAQAQPRHRAHLRQVLQGAHHRRAHRAHRRHAGAAHHRERGEQVGADGAAGAGLPRRRALVRRRRGDEDASDDARHAVQRADAEREARPLVVHAQRRLPVLLGRAPSISPYTSHSATPSVKA